MSNELNPTWILTGRRQHESLVEQDFLPVVERTVVKPYQATQNQLIGYAAQTDALDGDVAQLDRAIHAAHRGETRLSLSWELTMTYLTLLLRREIEKSAVIVNAGMQPHMTPLSILHQYRYEPLPVDDPMPPVQFDYIDRLPVREAITSNGEVIETPVYRHNYDIPDRQHSIDQGFSHPVNTHLEGHTGSLFRELCVQRGSTNHMLFLRGKKNLIPPPHLRNNWIAKRVRIPLDLAWQLVQAFKKLSVDRKLAMRILFGTFPKRKRCGIAGLSTLKARAAAAKQIIDLAADELLTDPVPARISAEISDAMVASYADDMDWVGHSEFDEHWDAVDELLEPPIDDDLDSGAENNPFSTRALAGDGSDSVSHDFVVMIKSSDWAGLKTIMAGFFPTETSRGYQQRAKYWYLSQAQRSHAWTIINEHKTRLKQRWAKQQRAKQAQAQFEQSFEHLSHLMA